MIIRSVAPWVKWLFPPEDDGCYHYPDLNQHRGPRSAVRSSSSQGGERGFVHYEWRSTAAGIRHDNRYSGLDYPPSYRTTANTNTIPVHHIQTTANFNGQDEPGFSGDVGFAVSPTQARRSGSPSVNHPNEGITLQELAEFILMEGVVRKDDGKDVIISHPGSGQYSQGFGTSACGLAALHCVKIVLEKEREGLKGDALTQVMMMRQTTEDIMAICAIWNGDEHLEVEDICQIPYFKRDLHLKSTYHGRPSIKDFEEMLTQLMDIAGPDQVAAAVITRPPEIIACFIIPSSDCNIFTVFDSHPRPNYPEGAGFIFCSSVKAAASGLNAILSVDHHVFEDPDMQWQAQLLGTFVGHMFSARGVDDDEDGDGDSDKEGAPRNRDGTRQELMEKSLQGLELQVRLAQAKKRREGKAKSREGDGGETLQHSPGITAPVLNNFSGPFGAGNSQDSSAGASSSNKMLTQQPLPSLSAPSTEGSSHQQTADNGPFTDGLQQQLNIKPTPKRLSFDIPHLSDPPPSPDSPLEYLTPDISNHGDDIDDDNNNDNNDYLGGDQHRDLGKAAKGDSDNDSLDPRLYAFIDDEDEDRGGDITMYDDSPPFRHIDINDFDDLFEVTSFNCSICLEEFSIEDVATVEACDHQFCRECLRQYVVTQIEGRKYPILCPVCATIKVEAMFMITEEQIQQLGASEEAFAIFTELQMLEYAIETECRGCKTTIMVVRTQDEAFVCPLPQCQYRWCTMCSQEAPLNEIEHACDGSTEFEVLVNEQGWKRCPGCQIPVHKIIGCYHMTCVTPGCRTHFRDRCEQIIIKDDMVGVGVDAAVKKHYTECDLLNPPNTT